MTARKKISSSPLLTNESERWIATKPLTGEGKEKIQRYLLRFVTESEAIGVTGSTNGFIDDLSINTTERASSFLLQMRLKADIKFKAFNTPADLAKGLRDGGLADDSFTRATFEFVYLCSPGLPGVAKRVKELKEFAPGEAKKKGKKRQNKSEFHRLDAVFRHLRNAFAHGRFCRLENASGDAVWALQDSNSRGKVTARLLIKESTLDEWLKLLMGRDKRYRPKKN